MQWITENWVLVVFGGGMIAMHLFGHRGHGSKKGGGGCCGGKAAPEQKESAQQDDVSPSDARRGDI